VALAAVAALLVVSPWMLDLHHYSGTFFFPILGHGYEYSTYHLLAVRNITTRSELIKCVLAGLPLLLLAAVEFIRVKWSLRTAAIIAVTAASGLATIATGLATGGDAIRRYSYPQIMVALLLLYPLVCHVTNGGGRRRVAGVLKTAVIAVILLGYFSDMWSVRGGFVSAAEFAQSHFQDLSNSLRNAPLNPPDIVAEYKAVETSLPANSVALVTVNYPYLLDNRKNTYDEASLPAMASPPPAPGWPIFSNGEALGDWLLSHGVRYLIYEYDGRILIEDETMQQRIADTSQPVILRATWIAKLKAHEQYMELARGRQHIYDDGHIFVLDLTTAQPAR
jgi:hypothetical protein